MIITHIRNRSIRLQVELLRDEIDQIVVSAATSPKVKQLVDAHNNERSCALGFRHALLVQRQACGFRVKNQVPE